MRHSTPPGNCHEHFLRQSYSNATFRSYHVLFLLQDYQETLRNKTGYDHKTFTMQLSNKLLTTTATWSLAIARITALVNPQITPVIASDPIATPTIPVAQSSIGNPACAIVSSIAVQFLSLNPHRKTLLDVIKQRLVTNHICTSYYTSYRTYTGCL